MIDVTGEKKPPMYRRVADEIAGLIRSGHYVPGQPLPSETTLVKKYGATRNTVREAIKLLREQDLIETEHGRASYVRRTIPWRSVVLGPHGVTFEESDPRQPFETPVTVDEVAADDTVGPMLGVEPGTPVIARQSVHILHGVPHQCTTSYLPLDIAAGTALAEPDPDARTTTAEHLAELGWPVTSTRGGIVARAPSLDERDRLRIGARPVLAITRTMFSGERPVEAAVDVVIRGDAVQVRYSLNF